MKLTVKLW